MAVITWDEPTVRTYRSGIDRGVFYPIVGGNGFPWNGLTEITEKSDDERKPIYYDGMKINDLVVLGDYEGTLKAVTFPDVFTAYQGFAQPTSGKYLGNQKYIPFHLSYRVMIGNADDPNVGYEIHIIYNVTAIPNDRSFATQNESLSLTEFEWEISAVPIELDGFRPTAHVIINSTYTGLSDIEDALYGTVGADGALPTLAELFA